MNADNLTMLRREEDVEANVSLHLHAMFKSCLLIFDAVCAVSAFSLIQGCNTLSPVLRTIVVCSCLERAPVDGRRFRPSVAVVSGCRFRSNLGRMEFGYFLQFFC